MRLFVAALAAFFCASYAQASPIKCLLEHELAHAGGWPADHPGAIRTKECMHLPMPPHKFPVRVKPVIHYVPRSEMVWHCGPGAQACSTVAGNPSVIYLPTDPVYD